MKKVLLIRCKRIFAFMLLFFYVNTWSISAIYADNSEEAIELSENGFYRPNETRNLVQFIVTKHSQYLTIQDSNPVNTITVKITSNETGATVFENVYPQGQTSFIVIPINGWSAGSYTIELFGRENNGYLWGTFQVLP